MSNYGQGDLFERMETMKDQMAEQARDNEFNEQVRISQQQAREQAALTRGNPIMDAIVTSGYLLKVMLAGPVLAVTSPMWAPFKAGRHAARQVMEVCKKSKNGYFYRPSGSVFSTSYGKTNFTICGCGCGLIIGDGSLVSNE